MIFTTPLILPAIRQNEPNVQRLQKDRWRSENECLDPPC